MSVLPFTRPSRPTRPAPQPQATQPSGGSRHVYVVDSEAEGFTGFAVLDDSDGGDSVGHHGWFTDRAVAKRIGAASFTDYSKGGAA